MAGITGREMVIAAKRAGTWGTAVECGAEDGVLLTSFGIKQSIEVLKDDSLGIMHIKSADQGKVDATGNIGGYLRYDGLDLFMALCMGGAGVPVQQGSTDAMAYSRTLADNIDGLFATIALKKQTNVISEFPSVKIYSMKLAGEMNKSVTFEFGCMGNLEELESLINTILTMANVTYPETGNRVILSRGQNFYCRMNDASGAALGAGNNLAISGFELSFARSMEQIYDFVTTGGAEPSENDHPSTQLVLNFPKYDAGNKQFFLDWNAGTPKKGELFFRGGLIGGTYYRQMKFSLPNMLINDADATPGGPGRIPAKLTFDCMGCDAAPSGMTGILKPFQVDGINTLVSDPLTGTLASTIEPTTLAPTTAPPTTAAP